MVMLELQTLKGQCMISLESTFLLWHSLINLFLYGRETRETCTTMRINVSRDLDRRWLSFEGYLLINKLWMNKFITLIFHHFVSIYNNPGTPQVGAISKAQKKTKGGPFTLIRFCRPRLKRKNQRGTLWNNLDALPGYSFSFL